jgi:hypothetical protein
MGKRKFQPAGNAPGRVAGRSPAPSKNSYPNSKGTNKSPSRPNNFAARPNPAYTGAAQSTTTTLTRQTTSQVRLSAAPARPNPAFDAAVLQRPAHGTIGLEQMTQELPRVSREALAGFTYPRLDSHYPSVKIQRVVREALALPPKTAGTAWPGLSVRRVGAGLLFLVVVTFLLRLSLAGMQSAYMDESSFILTGRYLFEQQAIYAGALNWSYGSYLWPVIAGLSAMAGGLEMVRVFTALCGVLMVLATGLFTARLLPRRPGGERNWGAAFLASLVMALLPTAIGLGRFGTYDNLAGVAFMGGLALLIPASGSESNRRNRRFELLPAALLLFVAFLAKYLDAIYFPVICLALIGVGWKTRNLRSNLTWFVGPLSLACFLYFMLFSRELLNLLAFSTSYEDLASPQPWREYVAERLEIWALAIVAAFGLWQVRRNKLVAGVCVGGAFVMVAFQAVARPDFDYWKHSIYLIFFLAPLAGLALAPLVARLVNFYRTAWPRPNRHQVFVGLILAGISLGFLFMSVRESQKLVSFYPNLKPSLGAIQEHTAQAKKVLTNDGALRFYLYPRILTEFVTDPFFFQYQGKEGMTAYKAAVTDRYFDTVVLAEGSGPQGRQLREELTGLLSHYYRPVYASPAGNDSQVMIYRPVAGEVSAPAASLLANSKVYLFDAGHSGWGGQPENGELKPGGQVKVSRTRLYQDHATLEFQATADTSILGVKEKLEIRQVKFWVYIEPASQESGPVPVGIFGFDANWGWHDDGFKQTVTPGEWTELTWDLKAPGQYNEIGLKFAGKPLTAYLGKVIAIS